MHRSGRHEISSITIIIENYIKTKHIENEGYGLVQQQQHITNTRGLLVMV